MSAAYKVSSLWYFVTEAQRDKDKDKVSFLLFWGKAFCSLGWSPVHYVANGNLRVLILPPSPTHCWDYMHVAPYLFSPDKFWVCLNTFINLNNLYN